MFKRKWLWIIPVILAVVAVVGGFVASGSMPGASQSQVAAAGPEQGDERGVDTLVEPKYPPPSQAGQAESTGQEGGEPKIVSSTQVVPLQNIWHRSTLWPAYKSGDDAVGKGRSECGCAGCWFPLDHNVTVTLWKAQPGEEWEEAATGYMGSCCPPRCDIYALGMDTRRYFIAGVVILLMTLVVGCGTEVPPREIVSKACDATSKVESYRVTVSTISTLEEQTSETFSETEFVRPDRWHAKITTDGSWREFINIEERQYSRDSDRMQSRLCNMPLQGEDGATSTGWCAAYVEEVFQHPDSLVDVEELSGEEIAGVECFRYRGKVEVSTEWRTDVERWIGKDDFLIRQIKSDMESTSRPAEEKWMTSSLAKYYDFNQPIEIEPPV